MKAIVKRNPTTPDHSTGDDDAPAPGPEREPPSPRTLEKGIEGAPTEDSPTREVTERVEPSRER